MKFKLLYSNLSDTHRHKNKKIKTKDNTIQISDLLIDNISVEFGIYTTQHTNGYNDAC
jgi:hypothetical protein